MADKLTSAKVFEFNRVPLSIKDLLESLGRDRAGTPGRVRNKLKKRKTFKPKNNRKGDY